MSVSEPQTKKTRTKPAPGGADVLSEECFRVSYTISWLPQSKALAKEDKQAFANLQGGESTGYSLSKKLYSSTHPCIRRLNAARNRFNDLRERYTIIVCQKSTGGKILVDAGVRLIHKDDVEKFDKAFRALADDLYLLVDAADAHMDKELTEAGRVYPSIKEMDKQALGKKFDDRDYPQSLRDRIAVSSPTYEVSQVSVKLPPEVMARERDRVAKLMETTLDGAVQHVAESLIETFGSVASQLANRERVNPVDGSLFPEFDGCEVVARGAEGGKYVVRLRSSGKGDVESEVHRLEFPTKEEFEAKMRPLQTTEKRRLSASTLEILERKILDFTSIRKMLGDHGKGLDEALSSVRKLVEGKGGTDETAKALRKNESARETFRSTLETAVASITSQMATVKRESVARRSMDLDD